MTLTELRYIVALSRERHFGRAAEACHVSQPTLSVAIRKLEDELGVVLFERNSGEISLTAAGTRIVEQAARVLEEAQTLRQMARHAEDALSGPLRLGAIYTVAPYLLPPLIPELHALAPQMPLLLEENFTYRLAERLRQGELDVILVALPFDEAGVRVRPLYREPFRVLLPDSHPWRERDRIAAEELRPQDMLLLGTGHCFRDQVLEACLALQRGASAGLQQTLQSGSLETIRYMVASGAGISVMPCTATGQHPVPGLIDRPFAEPEPFRTVAMAWRKSFPRQAALDVLYQAATRLTLPCIQPQ